MRMTTSRPVRSSGSIVLHAGRLLGLALCVLAALWAFPAAIAAAPPNVLLARGRSEPVVAIDPRHPSIVVVGSNTNYDAPVAGTFPTAYFASQDGGRSFTSGNVPVTLPYTTAADPTVQIDRNGTVFYSYLGETPGYCSGGHSAVLLTHSIDHGRSFRSPTIIDVNSADDKPNMAIQSVAGHPSHLFLTWTRWLDHRSEIWYARSLDGGLTFSAPIALYSSSLDNFGSVPVVGPGGRVYVFWSVFPEEALSAASRTVIEMRVSIDAGAHFQAARTVAGPFWSVPRMAEPGHLRNLTQAALAVGRDGALYLAWASAVRQHGPGVVDANINLIRSLDGGASWSRPVRVNDVTRSDRFMPSMSVLPDGSLGLAFYDRRRSPSSLDLYAAHVSFRHGFQVSPNVRVNRSQAPISDIYYLAPGSTCFSPGRFFGDYIGTAACGGNMLCAVWADTQLHVYSETDIWFARVNLLSL